MTNPVKKSGLTKGMVEDVRQYRLGMLEKDIPVKQRGDFESEDEYRTYLLNSYVALRQEEYRNVVRNETMKVYNLAMDGAAVGSDNLQVWNGYKKYIDQGKTPEEKKRRQEQVNDCAISRAPQMGSMCFSNGRYAVNGSNDLHCCAITSSAVVAQISGEMGYDGDQNLVIAKRRDHHAPITNNFVNANQISRVDSIQNNMRCIPEMQHTPKDKKQPLTLNQMVKTGKLGVGDAVGLAVGSGHAMVIADVIKDDKGNVTSYILQANNRHCFTTVNANNPNDYFGSRPVKDYVRTSAWATAQINSEKEKFSELSLEELEQVVSSQRTKTEAVINDLAVTESYNVAKGYCNGYQKGYRVLHEKAKAFLNEDLHNDMKQNSMKANSPAQSTEEKTSDSREELHSSLSDQRTSSDQRISLGAYSGGLFAGNPVPENPFIGNGSNGETGAGVGAIPLWLRRGQGRG